MTPGWSEVDFTAVFNATPTPYLLLTPDFIICGMNDAYLRVASRTRAELMGQSVFAAFPDNPDLDKPTGSRNLRASLERARDSKLPDTMALQRYDIEVDGTYQTRYWSPINTPVLNTNGSTVLLIHRSEDVTELLTPQWLSDEKRYPGAWRKHAVDLVAEQISRVQDLQLANVRERAIATELQLAMLPHKPAQLDGLEVAYRYRPATRQLSVGGDWYDVFVLPDGTVALSVGDVCGHGLDAAAVMGQLRSTLNGALRASLDPAVALKALDEFAHDIGSSMATVISAVIDPAGERAEICSAGHPPPLLVTADGTATFAATSPGPPIGCPGIDPLREFETLALPPSAVLVLYTDGLIERRGEVPDVGMKLLAKTAASYRDRPADEIATALESELAPDRENQDDDIALIVLKKVRPEVA